MTKEGGGDTAQEETITSQRRSERIRASARRVFIYQPSVGLVHPALIPGVGVEKTKFEFGTNPTVFAVSGLFIISVIIWAFLAPNTISVVGSTSLAWVTTNFGW